MKEYSCSKTRIAAHMVNADSSLEDEVGSNPAGSNPVDKGRGMVDDR